MPINVFFPILYPQRLYNQTLKLLKGTEGIKIAENHFRIGFLRIVEIL